VCLAYAQLKSAVRMSPTCGVPVGDGQKRTRTSLPVAVLNGYAAAEEVSDIVAQSTVRAVHTLARSGALRRRPA
jgi:hypothetical protein